MGQGIVEGNPHPDLFGICHSYRAEEVLVSFLSRPEKHELETTTEHVVQRLLQKVKALLACQARNHSNEGHVRALRQAKGPLQVSLAGLLAEKSIWAICLADERIGLRIPHVVVDAIENTDQAVRPLPEDTTQTKTLLGGLDFFGMCWAHRGNAISENKPPFEEVDFPVELQIGGGEESALKIQQVPILVPEHSLVRCVVNGEDGLQRRELRMKNRLSLEKSDGEGSLPIVCVQNIGRVKLQHLQDGPAEEDT